MYFTFPSFKNIATQRSFNEILHFPLHCLKSTFSFQKSCRKSEKWFWGDLCNCPSEILQKVRKNDFGVIFSIFRENFQSPFFPSEILQKVRKNDFWAIFSIFSELSKVHFCPSGILQKLAKNYFWSDFFTFQQICQNLFFSWRNPLKNLKKSFLSEFFILGGNRVFFLCFFSMVFSWKFSIVLKLDYFHIASTFRLSIARKSHGDRQNRFFRPFGA